VLILKKNVKDASLVTVSNPGIIPKIFAVKIVACVAEDVKSFSSQSLISVSSSSNKNNPILAKPKANISFISIISYNAKNIIISSIK